MADTIREIFLSRDNAELDLPDKPFVRRMLDPSTPTVEIEGEEASVKTMSADGKVFPTVVPQEKADGSYALTELSPDAAYELAMRTGNYINAGNDADADLYSQVLSKEAGERRRQYKNNQAFLESGGKSLGDLEFRADVEPYVEEDALTRLGLELQRRGLIQLKGIPLDTDIRFTTGDNVILGGYEGTDSALRPILEKNIALQNPLTRSSIMERPNIATYVAGESDIPAASRSKGVQELTALHELRHGAIDYLFNNTDLKKQKYFDNFDSDVEEDIMDMIDDKILKDQNISLEMDKVSKVDPKYIGGKERLNTITQYANDALSKFNVPEYTKQKEPGILQKLFGMQQGGIMMAQTGKTALPMTEATSAPQGGGPKAANPAAKPSLVPAPTAAPRPGAADPRDAAIQEVSQKMKEKQTAQMPPSIVPAEQPASDALPQQPVGGLAAPTNMPVPMMAKGGMKDDSSEGLAVMIGLGAPTSSYNDYEDAAEGNPPPGATKEEVADDQLVLLSEGELVVPANVVRYHGLGTYESMRREALMGLQDMEQNGQIEYVSGGAEKADKIDDNGGIVKAQAGTYLMNTPFPSTMMSPQYKTTALAAPVAASSQYIKTPGTPALSTPALGTTGTTSTTSLTPLSLGQPTPNVPTDITGVYAPNVGEYLTRQTTGSDTEDGTGDTGDGTDDTTQQPGSQQQDDGGSDGREPTSYATTVFGGTSENGLIRGGTTYEVSYESSTPSKVPGVAGALLSLGNLDQVRLTDPRTGQSALMSKETYNKMKENRTDPANLSLINDIMAGQQAVDYNLTRAREIAPFKTGIQEMGAAFGLGRAPGSTKAEQQAAAKAIADDMGIGYTGQSLAEMIAMDKNYSGQKSPVYTSDAQGNLVLDTRYSTGPTGATAAEAIAGAGQFSGTPAAPVAVDRYTGPYTEPTLGLGAPSFGRGVGMTPAQVAAQQASYANFGAGARPQTPEDIFRADTQMTNIDTGPITFSSSDVKQMQASINRYNDIRNDLIRQGVDANTANLQAQRQTAIERTLAPSGVRTGETLGERQSYQDSLARGTVDNQMQDAGFTSISGAGTRGFETRGERAAYEAGLDRSAGAIDDEMGDVATISGQGFGSDFAKEDANVGGYSPGPSVSSGGSYADNKAAADAAAQDQTGNPNASAVTDSNGNAVTSGSGSIVTSGTETKDDGGSPSSGCVIATHAVKNGGFSVDVKREAVRWCVKNLHRKWYGEAIRRGYRYHGNKAIAYGRAHNHYEEFKDYVDFATGKKRNFKNLGTFVYRTIQFFITGLFV
jgi:hypothetical protein